MEVKMDNINQQSAQALSAFLQKNKEIEDALAAKEKEKADADALSKVMSDAKDERIKELEATIATMENTLAEMSRVNQKLFLKLSAPLTEEPVPQKVSGPKEEDPLVTSALEKIEAYNKEIETKEA